MQKMLSTLGLDVSITERKDLFLNGKKISGSAQSIKEKILFIMELFFTIQI